MHQTQREQTIDLLKSKGIQRALFAHPHSVTWLTGFTSPIQMGQNLFAGGPSLVWYEDSHFTLIVLDAYAADAEAFGQERDGSVITYQGYTIERPIASTENLASALENFLVQSTVDAGRVGLESSSLTGILQNMVIRVLPSDAEVIHIDNWLVPLRTVKTQEELANLRANFALTDLGHRVARETVRAGMREIDVWTAVHSAIQQEAGQRVPLGNDCVVGYRKANIGGWPRDYEIREHDSLILDLSTVQHGYWSDSCATYYAGTRIFRQEEVHKTVLDTLEYATSLIRPGVVAREVDEKVRDYIRKAGYTPYPHHTGHGVGVSGHEAPRIVPYSEEVLQAGMLIMLEPGIYFPGEFGVRLEDGMLVTQDGVEILTRHDKQ